MKDLIDVFKMDELPIDARVNVLIKLGQAINHQYAANITEPVVYELVKILDPNHSILTSEHYLRIIGIKD